MAGGENAKTQVARFANARSRRSQVSRCSPTTAPKNARLLTTKPQIKGFIEVRIPAHITIGRSGKNARLVKTTPTSPVLWSYPFRAMSMYQLVSHEPSSLSDVGTDRSLLRDVAPSHHSTRTARRITKARDKPHARIGTRQRDHHELVISGVVVAIGPPPV